MRLIAGVVALAVFLVAAPASAEVALPDAGLLRGRDMEYWLSDTVFSGYVSEATDGDLDTYVELDSFTPYLMRLRYAWAQPMRITGIHIIYRRGATGGTVQLVGRDASGEILWSSSLPGSANILHSQRWDLDIRGVGSIEVIDAISGGKLHIVELEAYGEPESSPPPPVTVLATPGDGQVRLAWSVVNGADSYEVEMRPAGGEWQPAASGLTGNVVDVTGLENGQAYEFRVRAVAGGIPGDWSDVVAATPAPPVPPAPTGLTTTAGDGQVTVTWEPVEGADSYDVQLRPAGGDWQPAAIGLTATTYTVTGLENGQVYEFRVRAVAGGIPGDWSQVLTATPKALPPWRGLFGGLVAALPAYVGGAVTGIAPIVLIPAAVTLAVALGNWFLGRLHLRRQKV